MPRCLVVVVLVLLSAAVGSGQPVVADDPAAPRLVPTRHPAVPDDPTLLWLAPDSSNEALPEPLTDFATAVALYEDERYSDAFVRLDRLRLEGPLDDYVRYYLGCVQLRLGWEREARATFGALRASAPLGHVAQASTIAEAEAAEAGDDFAGAARLYARLTTSQALAADRVWLQLGRAAVRAGDLAQAATAFRAVRYRFPLSELAGDADEALAELSTVPALGEAEWLDAELARAQRLFEARRYPEAHAAWLTVRAQAAGDDRRLVDIRLGAIEVQLWRFASARERLAPYVATATADAEAAYWDLQARRGQGRDADYVRRTHWLVDRFPETRWAEDALDALGTHAILADRDDDAADVFRDLFERFPSGRHADRAAWKVGWSAYISGRHDEVIDIFERAAVLHPRSNYRPAYLYWTGRAHEHLRHTALARARYALTVVDYGSSYYGRRAAGRLARDGPVAAAEAVSEHEASASAAGPNASALPPTADLIRALIRVGHLDAAMSELQWASLVWGDSSVLQATRALVHNRRGELRLGINVMKRAYPQYLTGRAGRLPRELLEIVFPIDYAALIQTHSIQRDLDPHLIAALVAQESTFDAGVRSPANAWGLMQLVPATGRRWAREAGVRYSRQGLTDPETNIRLGTTFFRQLLSTLGSEHLALAGYNAGDGRVKRWMRERRGMERDEFIDDIPFPETQNYVKRVLGTADDYRLLYPNLTTQP